MNRIVFVLTSILIVVTMVFSAASCSSKEPEETLSPDNTANTNEMETAAETDKTPDTEADTTNDNESKTANNSTINYQEYYTALNKTRALSDLHVQSTEKQEIELYYDFNNISLEVYTDNDSAGHNLEGDDMLFELHENKKTKYNGKTELSNIELYADADFIYLKNNNMTDYLKVDINDEDVKDIRAGINAKAMTSPRSINRSDFYVSTLERNPDGSICITAVPDINNPSKDVMKHITDLKESMQAIGGTSVNCKVTSDIIKIKISSKGFFIHSEEIITITATLIYLNKSAHVTKTSTINVDVINPGKPANVLIPYEATH